MKPEFAYNIGIKRKQNRKQSQEEGKHEKKVISILLTAAMAVTLFAGCGDEKSADSQGNQSSGDAKTVTMMSWYSEDQMDDVIDAIEKKLGGEYKIDYTYVTNSDYNNVLSTQLAAGEGPDIIADGANFPARIKAGNVKDITDTGITDGFSDEGLALCTIDGKKLRSSMLWMVCWYFLQ